MQDPAGTRLSTRRCNIVGYDIGKAVSMNAATKQKEEKEKKQRAKPAGR
jgi:hypothetical protein